MALVPAINLDRELDRLFQAPFAEFVGTRNGLATQLKKADRADDAARVRGLAKPTYTAWLVNQLHWNARDEMDAFMKAADKVRAAEHALLEGRKAAGHPEALGARADALDALMRRASTRAADEGAPLSPPLAERLRTTLDAIGAYGSSAARHAHGRLQDDLDPPGFSAFAALAQGAKIADRKPAPARTGTVVPPTLRVVSPPRETRAAEEARAALLEAHTTAARAQDAADAAAGAERKARVASEAARGRLQEAERAMKSLQAEMEATAAALRARQGERKRAAQAAAVAQRELQKMKDKSVRR